jgi:hypothetical protein
MEPPSATSADAVVASAGLASATGLTGGAGGGGERTITGQVEIVSCFDHDAEWPSRVWSDRQDEDGVTVPLPPAMTTVSEKELPSKETLPLWVVAAPPVGVNTILQSGVLCPWLPYPDELKAVQWKVTDWHTAVALTVCAWALAVRIAKDSKTSGTTLRTRGTRTARRRARVTTGVGLCVFMLELLGLAL